MELELGIKSDPIESRYSFEWLFELLQDAGVRNLQLGSFAEIFTLEDGWFLELRRKAERRGVRIRSCFTTHRDLGGFFLEDPWRQRATRRMFERLIRIAALVGAEAAGGNPGSVPRDQPDSKESGIARYLGQMKELMGLARREGLQWLALEPMSCLAEPPTLPEEVERILGELGAHHRANPETTVPVYCCSDIGHGYADAERRIVHDNWSLFERQIPFMGAFHIKNTDRHFDATFGFSAEERARGIVDLQRLRALLERHAGRFPVRPLVGYYETGGPKVGRDYSDGNLERDLRESLTAIQAALLPRPPVSR
jgi:sugar phosphate isomerase/epimerase